MPLLARILLEKGFITRDDLQKALLNQIISGKRLGRVLVEEKIISDVMLNKALSIRFGVEPIPPELYINPVRPLFPEIMEEYPVYPWERTPRFLKTAMLDPTDRKTMANITYKTGLIVKAYSIPEVTLRKIYSAFGIPIPEKKFYRESIPEKIETIPEGKRKISEAKNSREVLEALLKTSELFMKNPIILIVFGNRIEIFGKEIAIPLESDNGMITTVIEGKSVYIGTPKIGKLARKVFSLTAHAEIPDQVCLIPVRLKNRVVNIIAGGIWKGREEIIPEFIVIADKVEKIYNTFLQKKWEKIKSST